MAASLPFRLPLPFPALHIRVLWGQPCSSITVLQNQMHSLSADRAKIKAMEAIVHVAVKVLTIMFFTGLVGSSVVVIISFIEDLHELAGD